MSRHGKRLDVERRPDDVHGAESFTEAHPAYGMISTGSPRPPIIRQMIAAGEADGEGPALLDAD